MRLLLSNLILLTLIGQAAAQKPNEWPQLLGPQRNGISAETGLLDTWPEGGVKEVWRVRGGVGMSGLAISRERLVTMVQTDAAQRVLCLDAKTGESIWQSDIARAFENGQGNGPRATPTIAGDTVFAFTGEGILAALQFDDGKIRWSHNLLQEHGGRTAAYGMACSPLVVGKNVVVTIGAPRATVVALDIATGKLAWTAGKTDPAGYSSPAVLDVAGRPQLVVFTGGSLLGIAPTSGEVLWRHPYKTDYECNIATPLAWKNQVFVSAGENHGSVLLKITPKGDKFEITEAWASQGVGSVLRNEWQTSMLLDGFLYGFDNVGSAGPVTHLTCVRIDNGERVWREPRFGKGNLIAAEGKLFLSTIKGDLVIVKATPERFEELGRMKVTGFTRQAPSLCNGLLYLRDDREIVCLDVRKPSE